MSSDQDTKRQPIHIGETADGDRQFVIHPSDDDLFIRTGQQVIHACQLGISIEVWLDELRSLLDAVEEWATEHNEHIFACYAAPRGASIGLYFVAQTSSFNFDLADMLAPMNREWLKQFNVGMIEVHQIPESQVDRFILPHTKRVVFSNDRSAPQAMDA